jgi:hypothetical protein
MPDFAENFKKALFSAVPLHWMDLCGYLVLDGVLGSPSLFGLPCVSAKFSLEVACAILDELTGKCSCCCTETVGLDLAWCGVWWDDVRQPFQSLICSDRIFLRIYTRSKFSHQRMFQAAQYLTRVQFHGW